MIDGAAIKNAPPTGPAELAVETKETKETKGTGGSPGAIMSPRPRKTVQSPSHRPAIIDDITAIHVPKGARAGVGVDPPIVRTAITVEITDDMSAAETWTGTGTRTGSIVNHTEGNRAPRRQHQAPNFRLVR